MIEYTQKDTFHSKGWPAIFSMVMVAMGGACFILSCVAAMIVLNKDQ